MSIATGNFTGNGRDDIAAIYVDGGDNSEDLAVWIPNASGVFPSTPSQLSVSVGLANGSSSNYIETAAATRLYAGDVTGDGKPDLVWVTGGAAIPEPRIDFFANDGAGHFSNPEVITPPTSGSQYASAALADFNGDGAADLAFADSSAGVLLYQSTGTQLSATPQTITVASLSWPVNTLPDALATVDLNGDGVADLGLFAQGSTAENSLYPILDQTTPPVYSVASSEGFGSVPVDTLGAGRRSRSPTPGRQR